MSSGDVDVDQLVERTDTGVSTTSMLKRGTGTRDEDKHVVKAKVHTFADAVAKYKAAMNYLEGELLVRARTIQPPGDDGGGEPCHVGRLVAFLGDDARLEVWPRDE